MYRTERFCLVTTLILVIGFPATAIVNSLGLNLEELCLQKSRQNFYRIRILDEYSQMYLLTSVFAEIQSTLPTFSCDEYTDTPLYRCVIFVPIESTIKQNQVENESITEYQEEQAATVLYCRF